MKTRNIYMIKPTTIGEAKALEAFAKALKIKYKISNSKNNLVLLDLQNAVKQLNLVKKGKAKAKDTRKLLREL